MFGTGPPIKTFGGDALGTNSHQFFETPQGAAGVVHLNQFAPKMVILCRYFPAKT